MITLHSYQKACELIAYHSGHLSGDISAAEVPLTWFGRGADRLNVGPLNPLKSFRRLCLNQNPKSGERLTCRLSESARPAYDLTFSAPKSVSIMALVIDDEQIIAAHLRAVSEALQEAELWAMTRVRKDDESCDRVTGNLTGALFTHFTSRENDPQLHTHSVVFNCTYDQEEGQWKALQATGIYRVQRLLSEVYRASLRRSLSSLGYPTIGTRDAFEIGGISEEVKMRFSKRNTEIEMREQKMTSLRSPALRKSIARLSRKKKSPPESLALLRKGWAGEVSIDELYALERIKLKACEPLILPGTSISTALTLAGEHLLERRSVVSVHELMAEGLKCGEATVSLEELRGGLPYHPSLIQIGDQVTSEATVRDELALTSFIAEGIGLGCPFASSFDPAGNLREEQKIAVELILSSWDEAFLLTGTAGTGKSSILHEIQKAATLEGRALMACAPTRKATEILRKNGFPEAVTMTRLLGDKGICRGCKAGDIILLDEAGMVSVAQMLKIFVFARRNRCRVLLSGDSDQHRSVEAGDALRVLEQNTCLARFELEYVHRQEDIVFKNAIRFLKQRHIEAALHSFRYKGWIIEGSEEERYPRIAEDLLVKRRNGESCIVVCFTHREVDLASASIRTRFKGEGIVGSDEFDVGVLRARQLTKAQLRQVRSYQEGDIIIPRATKGRYLKGTKYEVVGRSSTQLQIKFPGGEVISIEPRKLGESVSVYEMRILACSRGDELLILENGVSQDRRPLIGGERVTVTDISEVGILVSGGRLIAPDFGHFTLGYATTSQRSQGDTVDHVLVAVDSQSAKCAARRDGIYVAASRGRKTCTFYTDNFSALETAAFRKGDRLSVHELISKR